MRILRRFVAESHHFGPGDEVFLAGKLPVHEFDPQDVDPNGTPWSADELSALRAKEDREAREVEATARAAADQAEKDRVAGKMADVKTPARSTTKAPVAGETAA